MKSIYFNQYKQVKKQFQISISVFTAYNGVFKVRNLNSKFHFAKSFTDEHFTVISIPPGAYEIESLNNEIKRKFDQEDYTEADYPFTIKPNFSLLDLL